VVNVLSSMGAFGFGYLQDRIGIKNGLILTIIIWVVATFWTAGITEKSSFWLASCLVGLAIGGSQAGSRAFVGLYTPKDRQGEFFGFWGAFSKLSAIAGLFSFGFLANLTGDRRLALYSTAMFFLLGLLLLFVNPEKKDK